MRQWPKLYIECYIHGIHVYRTYSLLFREPFNVGYTVEEAYDRRICNCCIQGRSQKFAKGGKTGGLGGRKSPGGVQR